jgi:CRP/FNR family cyclic AMP-dependent transcriptional regulator
MQMNQKDESARRALQDSFLGKSKAGMKLLDRAHLVKFPRGTRIYSPGDESRLLIVLQGEGRMYIESPEGQRKMVRYFRSGEVIGLVSILAGPVDLCVDTTTAVEGLALAAEDLINAAEKDANLALAMAIECSHRVYGVMEELKSISFDPLPKRLARLLLNIAHQPVAPVQVRITQQEMGESINATREAVSRTLRTFREKGWVATDPDSPGLLRLLDPDSLRLTRDGV